jgi:hypothetical protein
MTNKPSRDQIREKVLGAVKAKSIEVDLFGITIELRQPTLKSILEAQEVESTTARMAQMIVNYAHVPGTDEHVFDEADIPMILSWPFGDDLMRLQKAITTLTGVDIAKSEAELSEHPLEGSS